MAKSSKRKSKSNMRRKLSTKELHSIVKHAKRKIASNKRKLSHSKKGKKKSGKKKSGKKSKKHKSSRKLKGGDGYSVDVSQNIAGRPIYEKYAGCKGSTKNNFNMRN